MQINNTQEYIDEFDKYSHKTAPQPDYQDSKKWNKLTSQSTNALLLVISNNAPDKMSQYWCVHSPAAQTATIYKMYTEIDPETTYKLNTLS